MRVVCCGWGLSGCFAACMKVVLQGCLGCNTSLAHEPACACRRYELLESHFVYSAELFKRPLHRVKVTDFFGSVSVVKQTRSVYPLQGGVLADQAVTLRDTGPQPPGTAILALQHGVDALQTCTAERAREIIADEERQQPPPLQPVLSGPGDVVGQGPALAGTDWVTWCGIAGLAAAVGCTLLL